MSDLMESSVIGQIKKTHPDPICLNPFHNPLYSSEKILIRNIQTLLPNSFSAAQNRFWDFDDKLGTMTGDGGNMDGSAMLSYDFL
jgi:hypothetical protein